MKKLLALSLVLVLGVLTLSGCGTSRVSSEAESAEEISETVADEEYVEEDAASYGAGSHETKVYDVEVYSDRRLTVTLSEISTDKVIFSVSNTSDAEFTLSLDYSLDGQVIGGYDDYIQF